MITSIIKNKIFIKIIAVLFWILLWQAIYAYVNKEILIVSPFTVIKTIIHLSKEISFWQNILMSFLRVLSGYTLALLFGIILAVISFKFNFVYNLLYPAISIIKAAPVASFIILTLLWIKTSNVPIFISFLMVFPIIWSNIYEGIQQTDKKLLEMAEIYNFNKFKTLKLIYIPSVMPYFISACTLGIGMAWKSSISAEVICTPKFSIGTSLYNSKIYIETPELFAWTFVVIFLSVILEKIFITILKPRR